MMWEVHSLVKIMPGAWLRAKELGPLEEMSISSFQMLNDYVGAWKRLKIMVS